MLAVKGLFIALSRSCVQSSSRMARVCLLSFIHSKGQLKLVDEHRMRDTLDSFGAPLRAIATACKARGWPVSHNGIYNLFCLPGKIPLIPVAVGLWKLGLQLCVSQANSGIHGVVGQELMNE